MLKILLASIAVVLVNGVVEWPCLAGVILPEFGMIEQSIIALATMAIFLPYVLIATFRQQKWLNAKVAEELKRQPTNMTDNNR